MSDGFSVVVMARETPDILARFFDHYRKAGAAEIHAYLDGPLPDLSSVDLDRVVITHCDAAFWDTLVQGEAADFLTRQRLLYRYALPRIATDWGLVVDIDEYLGGPNGLTGFSQALAEVPDDVVSVRIPNLEVVWGPGEDLVVPFGGKYARGTLPSLFFRAVAPLLYGSVARYFRRGLVGHSDGKQIMRRTVAANAEIEAHVIRIDGRGVSRWAHEAAPSLSEYRILHFDAIGYARWQEKWRRRADASVDQPAKNNRRGGQTGIIIAAARDGDDALMTVFRRFYQLGRLQLLILRLTGTLHRTKDYLS